MENAVSAPPPEKAKPAFVRREDVQNTSENRAVLKKNYDYFPPVTEYYKPDPAYNKVRWQGQSERSSGPRDITSMSQQQFKALSDNPSRDFLRQMVVRALAYSPEMRASAAEVLATEYSVDQARGQRWPQVTLGVTSPFTTVGGNASTNHNSHISDTSGSVSVTTPIIDWGRISSQVNNAEETAKSARYDQDHSREQLAYNTISELMNLSRYQRSRMVAKAYVDRMQELVNMLSQITEADPGRDSELVQAKAKLMSAQANMDNIEHQVSSSRIRLVRLLGVEPVVPEDISWRDTVIPASTAIASLDRNPMMMSLQAKVRAAEHEAESIRASSLPQVNWVISKSTAKDVNGNESGWYTGVNVEWNAFSGGSERAAQMSARARANAAQQQYEVSYRDLEYQINNQIQIRDSSFLRADDYDRLSSETDRVRQMFYDQWYHLGKRTLLDVLTAENDHFNNQLSAINNRYDGYISNINVISSASMLLNWVGISRNNDGE
ncbi:outer membrane component of a type I secretion system [Trabulsiella guamensis ATCC 49490]|uniref:Outer membrane component of a type I secretion system n=1 Tax=Trabulsiella guamensis ATCC 49490 TaxID=1005994 RepID=A0A085A1R5_9ENTR|nr:outer membrane component of a type I secretion system [Trabulsiella guamensis ATCC 49490]